MHIPAGLAYGALTSLNPVNGIYTSFFTGLVYVVFGTSRHLSVGTYAVISLMVYSSISRLEQKYLTNSLSDFNATSDVSALFNQSNLGLLNATSISSDFIDENSDANYQLKLKISSSLAFWCGIFQVGSFIRFRAD